MKRTAKQRLCSIFCILMVFLCMAVPCSAAETTEPENPTAPSEPQMEQILKKENGVYHCYENGTLVKKAWRTIEQKKYYFKADGAAATLSYKIGSKYYVFDKNGQLFQPAKKKVVTIGKVKYQVNPQGTAAKGWAKDKKYYFDKTGKRLAGTQVISGKFYAFSSTGVYSKSKTKKLQKAAKYEKDISALKKLIGNPQKKKYYSSCYGDGKDGVWTYKNFKVYTFKPKRGKEIYMGVEG